MDLPVAPERRARWALTRGIPGLRSETWAPFRVSLFYEEFQAFKVALLSPFWTGVDPTFVDQNVDRVEPGNLALEFVVMSLHELIQFMNRDTFGMLPHEAKN